MKGYHLTSDDVVPQLNCQFCSHTFSENDLRSVLQKNPLIKMLECPDCGLGTADFIPKEESVGKLYDPAHYRASLTSNSRISKKLAKKIVKSLDLKDFSSEISIVDFGGGNGKLCHEVRNELVSRGVGINLINCSVTDVFDSVDYNDIRFVDLSTFYNNGSSYDIVIASAVLEHLPNASDVLQSLLSSLNPAGVFYARTPYEYPLVKLPFNYKTSWPIHIHDMGACFWESIAQHYSEEVEVLISNTSTLETDYKEKFFRSVFAFLLKAPSKFETSCIKPLFNYRGVFWKYVGGWEVILRRKEND